MVISVPGLQNLFFRNKLPLFPPITTIFTFPIIKKNREDRVNKFKIFLSIHVVLFILNEPRLVYLFTFFSSNNTVACDK